MIEKIIVYTLREFGYPDWFIEYLFEVFWCFVHDVFTPWRWLDNKIDRLVVRFLAYILGYFNVTVESPLLEPEDPNYLPWYRRWDQPEDIFAFPTMYEWSFVFNFTVFIVACEITWDIIVIYFLGIPFSFVDLIRTVLFILFIKSLWDLYNDIFPPL